MANTFFQATQDALDNITSAFDFVHPLRASMKYTRRIISEMNSANPNITEASFQEEVDPDKEIYSVSYRDSYINTPWEAQEEQLAWLLLNNLFAIHEGWAQRIYEERYASKGYAEKTFIKNFEYPGLSRKFLTYYAAGSKKSAIMTNAYFDVYKAASQLDFGKLENYMLLYRYFKEARNCYMHHNFTATQSVVDRYSLYVPKATLTDLDTEEVPVTIPPILGKPIHLSLRGVIGFSQFIRRILVISDTFLIMTTAAEDEFLSRRPHMWLVQTLSGDIARAKQQITKYSNKVGLQKPTWSIEYQNFLIHHKIFSR